MLGKRPAEAPDRMLGRAVFARTCQQCHTLFDIGRKVGPDLTGSNRADLDYVLANVLDPERSDRQRLSSPCRGDNRRPRAHRNHQRRG